MLHTVVLDRLKVGRLAALHQPTRPWFLVGVVDVTFLATALLLGQRLALGWWSCSQTLFACVSSHARVVLWWLDLLKFILRIVFCVIIRNVLL